MNNQFFQNQMQITALIDMVKQALENEEMNDMNNLNCL